MIVRITNNMQIRFLNGIQLRYNLIISIFKEENKGKFILGNYKKREVTRLKFAYKNWR